MDTAFWNEPLPDLFVRLEASPAGLSSAEAAQRLARLGPNSPVVTAKPAAWRQFLRRIGNPLILILLLASGLSALAGDVTSFIIVAGIVLVSVILDFVQERHAERTMEALAQSVAVTVDVLRDGSMKDLPVTE